MSDRLKDVQGRLDAVRAKAAEALKEAGPDLDMANVKSIEGDKTAKANQLRAWNDEMTDLVTKRDALRLIETGSNDEPVTERETRTKRESAGEALTKSIKAAGSVDAAKNREFQANVHLKDLFETGDGWDPEETRSGRVELAVVRPPNQVASEFPIGTINQTAYKYMKETAPTFSGTQMQLEGGTFAEADLNLTETSLPVQKVTIWIPVTDEQLEDEDGARDYVNMRLRYLIETEVDKQVLTGDGTAPNLSGTLDQTGLNNVVLANTATPIIDAAGELFKEIRETGLSEPSVMLTSATEHDLIARAKTADGQYIWAHPSQVGPLTVFGVRMKPTIGLLPAGTRAVAGDFRSKAAIFVKRGLTMKVSDSHSTHFVEGKQAVRADMRLVVVHFRPSAFGTITTA